MKFIFTKYPAFLYCALYFLGVSFIFFRNPDPIFNPLIYAEDGTWISKGLNNGWLDALLNSRGDYFVFINILLLLVSTLLSLLIGGGTIETLPYTIAFFSYSFWSILAIFIFMTLNKASSPMICSFLGYILLLALPLGGSQNEIVGRILQLGFFMPIFSLMLFFWREHAIGLKKYIIDFMIFLAAGTNPIIFALAFLYFMHLVFIKNEKFIVIFKNNLFLIAIMAMLAVAILPRLAGSGANVPGGGGFSNFIEVFFARSILYPFIFFLYGKLSDLTVLVIFFIYASIVLLSLRVSPYPEAKKLTYATIITMFVYTLATIIMRPGIAGMINHYASTFPDRYFMGINILSSFLICLSAAQLISNQITKRIGIAIVLVVSCIYLFSSKHIVEWSGSKFKIHKLDFSEQICISNTKAGIIGTHIYPSNWVMHIPERYVNKNLCKN